MFCHYLSVGTYVSHTYLEEMLSDEADLTVTVVVCAVRPSVLRILGGSVDRGPSI
jgi:hypothetical protein